MNEPQHPQPRDGAPMGPAFSPAHQPARPGANDPLPPFAGGRPPGRPASGPPSFFTSKPAIGIGALILGLGLGAGLGRDTESAARPAAPSTVVVTATAEAPTEPADPPGADRTDEPTQEPQNQTDTTHSWGQKVGFSYDGAEITLRIDAPLPSSNMFDKNNLEAKLTVCNKGSDTIDDLSAEGMGLYAEDNSGGQYQLYGPYRTPQFPVYDYDGATLRKGKCRTGWVAFEDGKKAVRIAMEVEDQTHSWSKSGK